jgi:nicotinate-nucleotide adenylyltransferase
MVELAVKALGAGFAASDYEINAEGVSYTYKTIKHWRTLHPDSALFFAAGSDIFKSIGTWGSWESRFFLAHFIIVYREGVSLDEMIAAIPQTHLPRIKSVYEPATFSDKFGSILLYNMPPVPISSTHIRVNIAQERLPEAVYNYIVENKLYI